MQTWSNIYTIKIAFQDLIIFFLQKCQTSGNKTHHEINFSNVWKWYFGKKKLTSCETRYLLDMFVVYYNKLYCCLCTIGLNLKKVQFFLKKILICLNTNFLVNFECSKKSVFSIVLYFPIIQPTVYNALLLMNLKKNNGKNFKRFEQYYFMLAI